MDAWETLAALSTTGDAWERLNDVTGSGGNVPGKIIDELRFTLQPLIRLSGSIASSSLNGTIGQSALTGSVVSKSLSGTVQPSSLSGSIAVKEI